MISQQTLMLLDLINSGKNCNEICKELNITNKQLYVKLTNLKNKGFFFERKYYADGEIFYKPITNISNLKKIRNESFKLIRTSKGDDILKVLAFSDIHFGNKLERLDLVDRAFNYAIKNNIHILFCCGDIIDGTFSKGEKTIRDVYSQIDYFIKKYPFDKSILTFGVGGDHDYSSLSGTGQDFLEWINNYRHDVVVSSYNNNGVSIKDDVVILHHTVQGGMIFKGGSILLMGHKHLYRTFINNDNNRLCVYVPSLSDINESLPTAVEMTYEFKNGKISNVLSKQILFGDKDYVLSEVIYDLNNDKNEENNEENVTMNEMILDAVREFIAEKQSEEAKESSSKPVTLVRRSKEELSQIEKFNRRYKL